MRTICKRGKRSRESGQNKKVNGKFAFTAAFTAFVYR